MFEYQQLHETIATTTSVTGQTRADRMLNKGEVISKNQIKEKELNLDTRGENRTKQNGEPGGERGEWVEDIPWTMATHGPLDALANSSLQLTSAAHTRIRRRFRVSILGVPSSTSFARFLVCLTSHFTSFAPCFPRSSARQVRPAWFLSRGGLSQVFSDWVVVRGSWCAPA
ncbi:hypothetical protein BGZ63DRAFT_258221 [Mariannaea sp. PMI_226]|nr:hypothetical protein BGZ63DRAFT_258221 [Mariannaea sp. PMI_226]